MSTKKKPADEAAIDELRSDIAATRTDLGETVEALAAKTDVKERAKDAVRESGRQAVDRVEDSVRRRPASWGLVLAGVIVAVTAISVLTRHRNRSRY
jgi:hypothetical protein